MAVVSAVSVLDLPPDLLDMVMRLVPTRSLLAAACSCTQLRAAADKVPLHVSITSQTSDAIFPWLRSPSVAPRVESLAVRNVFRDVWDTDYTVFDPLVNLRVLVVAFCRIRPSFFSHLPTSLETLNVHMVAGPSMFSTSRVKHLVRLRHLSLVFAAGVDMVSVCGLSALPLARLEINRALCVSVREPLAVDDLRIHALEQLWCDLPVRARTLLLRCDLGPLLLRDMLPPSSMALLRRLSVSCLGLSRVPGLEDAIDLERLCIRFDVPSLCTAQLRSLSRLRDLEVTCDYGVRVSRVSPHGLHDDTRVTVEVAGAPWPASHVRSLFGQSVNTSGNAS